MRDVDASASWYEDVLGFYRDHLAFAVADRAALDEWAERFAAAGVPHSPVAPANSIPGAAVLIFRDPDNIQLELFYQPPG